MLRGDREPQPAAPAVARRVSLVEALEDPLEARGIHAGPVVLDGLARSEREAVEAEAAAMPLSGIRQRVRVRCDD